MEAPELLSGAGSSKPPQAHLARSGCEALDLPTPMLMVMPMLMRTGQYAFRKAAAACRRNQVGASPAGWRAAVCSRLTPAPISAPSTPNGCVCTRCWSPHCTMSLVQCISSCIIALHHARHGAPFSGTKQCSCAGRQVVSTDKAPGAVGPYSQAIKTGNLVFVSGQLGFIPGVRSSSAFQSCPHVGFSLTWGTMGVG